MIIEYKILMVTFEISFGTNLMLVYCLLLGTSDQVSDITHGPPDIRLHLYYCATSKAIPGGSGAE